MVQEEQEKEVSVQGERESDAREGEAQEERREEREVEAQEGHDGEEEMATQEKCVEAKKETNSMNEENDASNRHMTWWRDAWWVRVNSGPHFPPLRFFPIFCTPSFLFFFCHPFFSFFGWLPVFLSFFF